MLARQQSFTDASKKAAALKRSGRGCKPLSPRGTKKLMLG